MRFPVVYKQIYQCYCAAMHYGKGDELEKLELAMESAGVAWWWMELPSGAVFFSPNKANMIGRDAEDFIHYKNFTDLVHPDDYEKIMQDMRDHLEGRAPTYRTSYRIKHADGSWRRFFDKGRIVSQDKNGQVAIAGVVIDITELEDFMGDLPPSP